MTGAQVRWYFIGFFAVIVLVNGVMMTLALRTHSGLITKHPYEKGLAYNRVIEAQAKQDRLGWQGTIAYQNGMLRVQLWDRNKRPLVFDHATATMMRPTQSGMDFQVKLTQPDTVVEFPAKGLWHVKLDATIGKERYQQSRRIVIE